MSRKHHLVLLLVVVVALGVASRLFPLTGWTIRFVSWVRSLGAAGALVYALAYVIGTVLLVPGTPLGMGSGFLYGPVLGVLLVSPASVLAATVSFVLARFYLRDEVSARLARYPRFRQVDKAIEQHGLKVILLLRLEPLFMPFALLNYALGLTRIRLRDYVLGSWLGMLPGTITYVYAGSLLGNVAEVWSGRLPESSRLGSYLFWTGLIVRILLVIVLTRITGQALKDQPEEETIEAKPLASPPKGITP